MDEKDKKLDELEMNVGDLEFLVRAMSGLKFDSQDDLEISVAFFCRLASDRIKQVSDGIGDLRLM